MKRLMLIHVEIACVFEVTVAGCELERPLDYELHPSQVQYVTELVP